MTEAGLIVWGVAGLGVGFVYLGNVRLALNWLPTDLPLRRLWAWLWFVPVALFALGWLAGMVHVGGRRLIRWMRGCDRG
ncbi:hypothetical protein [Maricaulis maris]|uniref:Uncharacterized protein n=1 Tax=Maricaulis maris TaxID=74318 RepID=A0A495D1R4_9PROT|nr:hypothetical protein [Maricaulis maris]RKQ95443.1 hypothetical protein C7435_2545 [Maricaulis maris]